MIYKLDSKNGILLGDNNDDNGIIMIMMTMDYDINDGNGKDIT